MVSTTRCLQSLLFSITFPARDEEPACLWEPPPQKKKKEQRTSGFPSISLETTPSGYSQEKYIPKLAHKSPGPMANDERVYGAHAPGAEKALHIGVLRFFGLQLLWTSNWCLGAWRVSWVCEPPPGHLRPSMVEIEGLQGFPFPIFILDEGVSQSEGPPKVGCGMVGFLSGR